MFKVLVEGCDPVKGSKYSACIDLMASEDIVISAGETKLIGLGVAIDWDKFENTLFLKHNTSMFESNIFKQSHYLQLMLRSSLGKKGLILPNGVGIIDLDYKEEIKMIIHNPIKAWTQSTKLIIGDVYDTNGNGKCQYEGIDSYMGQNTYKFLQLEYGNVRFIRLDALDDFLNIQSSSFTIKKGDRIGQIALIEHKSFLFGIDTENKRVGGFGSTGK